MQYHTTWWKHKSLFYLADVSGKNNPSFNCLMDVICILFRIHENCSFFFFEKFGEPICSA